MPRFGRSFPCGEGKKEAGGSKGAGVAKGLQPSQPQDLGWGLPPSWRITCGSSPSKPAPPPQQPARQSSADGFQIWLKSVSHLRSDLPAG